MFLVHRKSTANYGLLQAVIDISGNISVGTKGLCITRLRRCIYTIDSYIKVSANRSEVF